jgi:hypothetical protein
LTVPRIAGESRAGQARGILDEVFPFGWLRMTPHFSATRALWPVCVTLVALALVQGCTVEPVTSVLPLEGGTWTSDGMTTSSSGSSGGASSGGYGDAGACQPGSVQTFQPSAYRPATAAWQGVCLAHGGVDPIQLFHDKCLGGASASQCAEFNKDYPACASCILTPDTADHYGPLIQHGGFVTGNVAGCLELTDPGALSCAKSVQALDQCQLASCEANCPVTDTNTFGAYNHCAAQAAGNGCGAYDTAAATCTDTLGDAGPEAMCLVTDFTTFYYSVVPLFCGPPPPQNIEAGMDATVPEAGVSDDAGYPPADAPAE